MEIDKHLIDSNNPQWSLYGSEATPNTKIVLNTDELIETYNLIMKELADLGIVNIRSN